MTIDTNTAKRVVPWKLAPAVTEITGVEPVGTEADSDSPVLDEGAL